MNDVRMKSDPIKRGPGGGEGKDRGEEGVGN